MIGRQVGRVFIFAAICALGPFGVLGAIIVVDTLDNTVPPKRVQAAKGMATNTPSGDPADYRFYARRAAKLQNAQPARGPQGAAEGTSVENLLTNPSLYVNENGFEHDELVPPQWAQQIDKRQKTLNNVLKSVGRLQLYHVYRADVYHVDGLEAAESRIIGTGFLVGPNIIMTNRHVANEFCLINEDGYPFRRDNRDANDAQVKINFCGIRDDEPDLCRVTKVLYVEPQGKGDEFVERDFALLQIDPGATPRVPLPLQTLQPRDRNPGRRLMVCGYPTTRCPLHLLQTVRVKRLSLGNLVTEGTWHKPRLYHSCLTAGGSSGSPVVDLETGTVWGVHFYWDGSHNIAEPMWEICKIDKVKELLGQAATDAPQPLPPLNEEPETDVVAHEQVSRPVLFVCGDNIKAGQALPSKWISSGGVIDERIRVTIRSVGRISRISSPSSSSDRGRDALTPLATGFVIAERMVIVPGALEELRRLDPDSSLVIEFDRSACLEQPIDPKISQRFDLEHVEHQSDPNRSPQWSLYRIRTHGSEVPPTPLSLIAKKPDRDLTDTRIAVIGHPFPDSRHPESVVARCFPPPFGVKRIAFGLIKRNQNDEFGPELWHDCSTSAGDMGAPIIDLTTGKVLGIHIGGTYLKGNQAAPMWNVLTATELQDIPEIQALLDSGR